MSMQPTPIHDPLGCARQRSKGTAIPRIQRTVPFQPLRDSHAHGQSHVVRNAAQQHTEERQHHGFPPWLAGEDAPQQDEHGERRSSQAQGSRHRIGSIGPIRRVEPQSLQEPFARKAQTKLKRCPDQGGVEPARPAALLVSQAPQVQHVGVLMQDLRVRHRTHDKVPEDLAQGFGTIATKPARRAVVTEPAEVLGQRAHQRGRQFALANDELRKTRRRLRLLRERQSQQRFSDRRPSIAEGDAASGQIRVPCAAADRLRRFDVGHILKRSLRLGDGLGHARRYRRCGGVRCGVMR